MRLLTVDSSVFVSAARPNELHSTDAVAFLAWVHAERPRLFLPTLALVEVAAALSRTGSALRLAQSYAFAISHLPNTVLAPLDESMARQAVLLGAQQKLRGADAVYLATSLLCASELVTLDQEQLERGAAVAPTLSPAMFLRTV